MEMDVVSLQTLESFILLLLAAFLLPPGIIPSTRTGLSPISMSDGQSLVQAASSTLDSLHVNKTRIQDSLGHTVILVGLNYGDYPNNVLPDEFNTGNLTQDAVNIRRDGFNTAELVMEWGSLETAPFKYNSTYETKITNEVNALTSQGLYVILKLHADCDTNRDCNNLYSVLGSAQYCANTSSQGGFLTAMQLSFYTTSASTNPNSGIAHLTRLWQLISSLTASNDLVVGYDPLNEPWYCVSGNSATIRSAWHARMDEMVSTLRNGGDNRIIFLEEAPNYDFYGDACCGLWFTPLDLSFTNWVSDVHFFKGEYPSGSGGYGNYVACFGDYTTLYSYWNTTAAQGNGCTTTAALWVHRAELAYPNQAFFVGEYGDLFANSPGDLAESWNINATRIFANDLHVTGWAYWGQGSSGTWVRDVAQFNPTTISGLASVIRGLDNAVYWSSFSRSWTGWKSLGGTTASAPVLCASTTGSVDLIVRGSDNSSIWHKTYSNGVWSGWDTPGGVTNAQPACAFLNGSFYVAVRGTDNGIWWNKRSDTSGVWSGWQSLGGTVTSFPVLIATPSSNRLDLVVEGASNSIWHMASVNGLWTGHWDSPGGTTPGVPAAVSNGTILHIVARGMSNELWYNSLSLTSNTWSGWRYLGGVTVVGPTLTVDAAGTIHLTVVGLGGGIWVKSLGLGSTWTGWDGAGGTTGSMAATAILSNKLVVLVRGSDQNVWYDALSSGVWGGWVNLGISTRSFPSVADAR